MGSAAQQVSPKWHQVSLADVCEFVNGHGFKASEWTDSGLPIIRIQNLNGSQEFNYYNGKLEEKWIVESGQILFAWAGTKGVSFGPCVWEGETGVLNQHIFKVLPKPGIDPDWLYTTLKMVTHRIEAQAHGFKATLLHVQKSDITRQKLELPSVSEQQKIAKIFSTWDKAIATTEKLLENSQQQKKALMQQLLTGKRRLPGFDSIWEETAICSMGITYSGGTPATQKPEFWSDEIPWVTPTDITSLESRHISATKRGISKLGVAKSSATIIPAGTLLVCTRATLGRMGISSVPMATNQGFKNLVPNENHSVDFLFYLFCQFTNELIRKACGSTFLEVSKRDFEKLTFRIPYIGEQQAIVEVLASVDWELVRIKRTIEHLTAEKKALMQELLSGRRRVQSMQE